MSPRRKTRSKPAQAPAPLSGPPNKSTTKNSPAPSTPTGHGQSIPGSSARQRAHSSNVPTPTVETNGSGKSRAKGKQKATGAQPEEQDAAQVPLPSSGPSSTNTSASRKRKRSEPVRHESPSSTLRHEAQPESAKSRTPPWQRNSNRDTMTANQSKPSRAATGQGRKRAPTPPPPPLLDPPQDNPPQNGESPEDIPNEDDSILEAGTLLLSRYRVMSVLGRGNFSTTYLAKSSSPSHKFVAIKRLKRACSGVGDAEATLLQYLQKHARGPPRNLVTPVSYFYYDDHFHLVLQALDSNRPLTLPECTCWDAKEHSPLSCPARHNAFAKLFVQILSGLAELHTHGVIHADLTPGNILYVPNTNEIKIIDMGNAIRPEEREAYAEDYNVQTTCYRAPEILLGSGPIGRRIDVWSVGIIALELLLDGEVVGDGMDGAELLRPPVEGRDALVRRVVELFGSVKSCEGGLFWSDVYRDLSTRFTFIKGIGRVPVGEKEGLLESVLNRLNNEGLKRMLAKMLAVDCSRRATVESLLRDQWIMQEVLGEWGRILAAPRDNDDEESDLGGDLVIGLNEGVPLERESSVTAALEGPAIPALPRRVLNAGKTPPSSPPTPGQKRLVNRNGNGNGKVSPEQSLNSGLRLVNGEQQGGQEDEEDDIENGDGNGDGEGEVEGEGEAEDEVMLV